MVVRETRLVVSPDFRERFARGVTPVIREVLANPFYILNRTLFPKLAKLPDDDLA